MFVCQVGDEEEQAPGKQGLQAPGGGAHSLPSALGWVCP